MAAIFYESSLSDPAPAVTDLVWDKALHMAGYALLAALFARAFAAEGCSPARAVLLAVICTSAYGASDEVHQMFTPVREADVADWIADTVGGTIGALAVARFLISTPSHPPHRLRR